MEKNCIKQEKRALWDRPKAIYSRLKSEIKLLFECGLEN
jgi:hypothetical protein